MTSKTLALVADGAVPSGVAAALRFAAAGLLPVLCFTAEQQAERGEACARLDAACADYRCATVDPLDAETLRAALRSNAEADRPACAFYNRRPAVVRERLSDLPIEHLDALIDQDLTSAFVFVKAIGEELGARGGGSLVLLGSIHDEKPTGSAPLFSLYAGALKNISREAALYYGEWNVRVNLIEAGPLTGEAEQLRGGLSQFYEGYEYKLPSGYEGTEADLADLALYLLSSQSRYVSGAEVRMDGGLLHEYIDVLSNARATRRLQRNGAVRHAL